ncbi:MAG: hypothetical protein M1839_004981 [Geoglossum umbratile]|nr:MAG: hypothetical protein M1839_004981 [Geoglossum umbratile]
MSSSLRRKPLPESTSKAETPSPSTTTIINIPDDHLSPPPPLEKEDINHHDSDEGGLEDSGGGESGEIKPLPPLPPPNSKGRWIGRARDHWRWASKRRKWIYTAIAFTLLLAIILSIALGLGLRKKRPKYNYDAPTHTGDLTYYDPGLGACGITSSSHDYICAISYHLFDAYSTSSNPNANPLCGKRLWFARTTGPGAVKKGDGGKVDVGAEVKGERVEVVVADRCAGCTGEGDLDVTETAFGKVAGVEEGRVGVVWGWVD